MPGSVELEVLRMPIIENFQMMDGFWIYFDEDSKSVKIGIRRNKNTDELSYKMSKLAERPSSNEGEITSVLRRIRSYLGYK